MRDDGQTERAGVIVWHDDCIALIERHRDGRHYWIFPGGGVEPGESLEAAATREALEELGFDVTIIRRVLELHEEWFGRQIQHFFLAQTASKTFGAITGPELAAQSHDNRYRRVWVPVGEVAELALLPRAAKDVVVEAIESAGWRKDTMVVRTDGTGP